MVLGWDAIPWIVVLVVALRPQAPCEILMLRYAHMVDNEVAHAARERLADLQL